MNAKDAMALALIVDRARTTFKAEARKASAEIKFGPSRAVAENAAAQVELFAACLQTAIREAAS